MEKRHYTPTYLLNPGHKITVNIVGLGGTGSHVLSCLGELNETLIALEHPGLHVYAYDHDTVSATNIGRQRFSQSDIGANKAAVLVTRINRYYGTEWEAIPKAYGEGDNVANITISCVDTVVARLEINKNLNILKNGIYDPMEQPYYWLDMGNSSKTGQVVLGTVKTAPGMEGVEEHVAILPTVVKMFPELRTIKDSDTPSCSMAEAIAKQDLYINSTLARVGMNILWKLFREGVISYHGLYLNLDTMCMNPIKVQ
ncbi:PRTRC_ThiF, PRTRC system ThiF family protein [uncultured Caudovirales phage]|uniref:PRTRC_ThiF, PRTRC system ThiF family protein n=1 Tax=uncultured Caudovirales phage TaxID=2100421 RepID=A0A6J5KZR8_9CAUD|nr:PRTRC_ThiF, PRTRC system ThiF family protein [uncultured Caudovirales phage]